MKCKTLLTLGVTLGLSFSSCATSPGEQMGEKGCECIENSGGDTKKIRECIENFHNLMLVEMNRQKSIGSQKNIDADKAFLVFKKCMDESKYKDSIFNLPRGNMPGK
ncbi:MAG: hypothetical protein HYZ54_10545 [Ignavibacteriae bacterium]|nr:hypothetical protein [Ignavibacteriota bacterium]